MKVTVKIPKNRLTAPIDLGEAMVSHTVCGVRLSYSEFPFLQFPEKRAVLFDAYSTSHKYKPFDMDCGVVAFPFCLTCMTDDGERVAYCGLRFTEARAVEWKTLCDKSALGRLAVDKYAAAVPITSGVCCIADETAYDAYLSHIKDYVHPLDGLIVLNGQTHTEVEVGGKKLAVFSTGWGDGQYNCYVGYSADGSPTAIVVDFGMIEYPDTDETPVEAEIDVADDTFVYDPEKTERENNIARQTHELKHTVDPVKRMRAFARRGYSYHSSRDLDAALADYLAAIECCKLITDRAELQWAWSVYDNAAELLSARSDYDSVVRLMTEALDASDGFFAGAYVRLIDTYQTVKRVDKALETAERMKEKRPTDPVAYIKYAECCVSAMDYGAAAEAFDRLATEFKLYENLFDEASCYIALGEHGKATDALERHPAKEQYEQYWYYKAYIDYKERRFDRAREHAEMSHALDGEYMPALYLLIDIESVLQEYHAVAQYAEQYKILKPDNEYGYSVCAEAHLMLGNYSECARNYLYLYARIKPTDKYAALAAMICKTTGDQKRCAKMLRILKRKRSAYCYGAIYGVYSAKYREITDRLDKVVKQLRGDEEFLFLFALYLLQTNNVVPAARMLGELGRGKNPTSEIVALQIRLADRLGDKKQFLTFFDYYVEHFVSADMPAKEKRALAERLMLAPKIRTDWLASVGRGAHQANKDQ